jgi:hypothetical protein
MIKVMVDNGRAITMGSIIDQGLARRPSMPKSALHKPKTVESLTNTNNGQANQTTVPTASDMRAADFDSFFANSMCTNNGKKALEQTPKNMAVAMAITPPFLGMIKANASEITIIIIVAYRLIRSEVLLDSSHLHFCGMNFAFFTVAHRSYPAAEPMTWKRDD